jgi:hypothetical protein
MKSKITLLLFLALLMSAIKMLAGVQAGSEITKIYVNNHWQPIAKTTTEFISSDDENCLISSTKTLEYSQEAQVYKVKSRTLYNYNSSMRLESKLTQIFIEANRKWENDKIEYYTYTRDGQLATTVIKTAHMGRWTNRSRTTLTYLPEGMLAKILVENFIPRSNNYEPVTLDVLLYNASGKLISQTQQMLRAISQRWENTSKTTFEYIQDQLSQKTNFLFDKAEKKYIMTDLEYFEYDRETKLSKIISQSIKPNTMQLITTGAQEFVYYLGQDVLLQVTQLKRNDSNGQLVNFSRINYTEYCKAPVLDIKSTDIENNESVQLNVYPNPGLTLTINLNALKEEKVEVRIFDTTGKLVLMTNKTLVEGSNTFQMDTADLPNGTYLVQLNGSLFNKHMNWLKQ